MKFKKLFQEKWLFLITFLGLILRFYKIKERFVWGSEQSLSLWPIVRMFEEKKLPLIGVHLLNYKSALFRPPFFIYIFALPLKIFNFNPLLLEIIFAVIGSLIPLIIYFSAKQIFNKRTAIISALIYAISFAIINIDKTIWTITPIIITSALILFLLTNIFKKSNKRSLHLFLIGCLVGLGFSFHFQAIIILISLTLVFLKSFPLKKTSLFLAGFVLFLSPLIIFNLRHDFIMIRGIKNLFYGNEVIVRQSQTLGGKLNNGLTTFADLALKILNLSFSKITPLTNFLLFFTLFIFPGFYIYHEGESKSEKTLCLYFLISCLLGLIGLMIINQGFYNSTAFYLWFLIPLLLVIWARVLTLLINTKLKVGVIITLILFIIANLYSIFNQKPTDYQQKIAIVNYVLKNSQGKKFSLKFINKDALLYDYLFYYRAPLYNLSFNDINLIEQWQDGKPDFFIIHGSYDWKEDKYHLLPYEKIADFNGIKIVTKLGLFE